jgi:ABC-type branched-subunit amino acid transport system substrate-binding protein
LVKKQHYNLWFLFGLLVFCGIAGCSKTNPEKNLIGILSSNPTGQIMGNFNSLATEQQTGYDLGLQNETYEVQLIQAGEGDLKDEVQLAIRSLVEKDRVMAIVGGTSNEATMRAASLVNFFNIPMVVPSASGEELIPSNNLWVFRLSAPSSAYANYIFGTLLLPPVIAAAGGNPGASEPSQIPKLAILYEPNTFGESAAVATATAAMKQSTSIVYYGLYPLGENEADRFQVQAQTIKDSRAHLVYLISNDPQKAISLVTTLQKTFGAGLVPIILGQGGGFTSQEFLTSPEAEGVYVIRQTLDKTICPAEVDSIYKAQSYAAVYLMNEAIKQADEAMPRKTWLSSLFNPQADLLAAKREKIRDILKQIDLNVPCMGQVTFEPSGQMKQYQFEILLVKDGQTYGINPQNFRATMDETVARDYQAIQ